MTARLPIVGGDDNDWGTILNGFLSVSHDVDGTLRQSAVEQAGGLTSDTAAGRDLSGTLPDPTVARINGIALPGTAPSANQVLTATSATTTAWQSLANAMNMRSVSANTSVAINDYLQVDASGGAITITAPVSAAGQQFSVEKTDASAFIVTVQGTSGATFDGNTTVQFTTQNGGATFIGDGTGNWRVKSITVNTPGAQGPQGSVGPGVGAPLTGFEPVARIVAGFQTATVNRGVAVLVCGQAYAAATVQHLHATAKTSPSAPTLCRMGIYAIDAATQVATLVARTSNNTGLFASIYSTISEPLFTDGSDGYPTSYNLVAGNYYALALVVVGGSVDPQYFGMPCWGGMSGLNPVLINGFESQGDLAASYTLGAGAAFSADLPWIGAT